MDEKELIEKYNINIEKLEKEQIKLAKTLSIKDSIDFSDIKLIASIENIMVGNQIISAVILVDKDFEIIEQEYFNDKLRFPYLHGFKAYRELPTMTSAFAKLRERPDLVLIKGEGINHSRLGIASHFAISVGIPVIGVSDGIFEGNEIKKDDVLKDGKKVGKTFVSKQGSKPLIICPGNEISVDSSFNIVKDLIKEPHKLPEPMHMAHRYAKDIKKELKIN
jgi:deoxyribonuclease V